MIAIAFAVALALPALAAAKISETTTTTGVVLRRLQRHLGGTDFYEAISGGVAWTHSGTLTSPSKTCSGQSGASYAVTPGPNLAGGRLEVAGYVGSDTPGILLFREYGGSVPMPWASPPSILYPCSDGSEEHSQGVGEVWSTGGPPDAAAPVVSADGTHLDGTFHLLSGGTQTYDVTYTWHLTSQPQN